MSCSPVSFAGQAVNKPKVNGLAPNGQPPPIPINAAAYQPGKSPFKPQYGEEVGKILDTTI